MEEQYLSQAEVNYTLIAEPKDYCYILDKIIKIGKSDFYQS